MAKGTVDWKGKLIGKDLGHEIWIFHLKGIVGICRKQNLSKMALS